MGNRIKNRGIKTDMKFQDMSEEAQQTAIGMIQYCLNNGIGMGMDHGFIIPDDYDYDEPELKPFRTEFEKLVQTNETN